MSGRVTLVGAGPGAADLLTLRAVDRLRTADVVLHDRLVGDDVLGHVGIAAELIPVGKDPGGDATPQSHINRLLVAHASTGRHVVRLKGGDPMVFGRGGEEVDHLTRRGIPVEVVPGITSAVGIPTSVGIPLTLRGVAAGFAVVPGEVMDALRWSAVAGIDTLVILMGVRRRRGIAAALIAAGRPASTPVAFVERGATAEQRVVRSDLATVAAGRVEVSSPAVWIVGDVAGVGWEVVAAGVDGRHLTPPARSQEIA